MKPKLNNVSPIYAGVNAIRHIYNQWTAIPIGDSALMEMYMDRSRGHGFRPQEWDSQVPEQVAARTSISDGTTTYFFDAVLRLEHLSANRITEHPIQSGANISDHVFSLPKRLVLEIGSSDVMDVFTSGQFSDFSSKSVSVYQTLESLRKKRLPLTVTTRLDTYQNMLIEQINAPDDFKTMYGLKCLIYLKQIITAQVPVVQVVSKKRQVTQSTNKGPVQSKPIENSSVLSRVEKAVKDRFSKVKTGTAGLAQ